MHSVTCKITSKDQVTIPTKIRNQLGVDVGDKVTFVVNDTGAVEVRPRRYSIEDLRGIVPTPPELEGKTVDEMLEDAFQDRIEQLTGSATR